MKLSAHTLGIVCLLALLAHPAASQKKEIVGYYPSWKWRPQKNQMSIDNIPFEKLTFINYAFFHPLPDGRMVGRDSIGDTINLKGKQGSSLTERAHRAGVKVLLSVGGWEDSDNFPEVASTESKRKIFAHSCIDRIKEFGFDGIDIDWEYPGYVAHKGAPKDKSNFTLLLQTLRDSLSSYGQLSGKKYFLTAALPAGESIVANYEVEKIAVILDRLNVMTYDLNGDWDSLSGHNAPLYSPRDDDSARNVDAAFKLYAKTYSVPSSKINLGVPFYGHSYAHCTSLYAPHGGSDTAHFSNQGIFYYDIQALSAKWKKNWDGRAKVPYLVNAEWNTLISYDDEESVGYKAQYVLDNKAAGVIIWEITGDYLPNGKTPLLDVINEKFKK